MCHHFLQVIQWQIILISKIDTPFARFDLGVLIFKLGDMDHNQDLDKSAFNDVLDSNKKTEPQHLVGALQFQIYSS